MSLMWDHITSELNWTMRHKQISEQTSDMHIPPDITFYFEEDENEIHAHKWMMAMASPVFHKMFFVADTKDNHAKKLLIKGTSFEAFSITKDAIYAITSMKNGLKGKSVLEVFSVLDFVTRYQICELQQIVRNHLAFFPLTDDTVLEVASTAMEKSSTFEDEARQLLIHCAKFIKTKLKTAEAVFSYIASHKEDQDVVYHLLALMDGFPASKCANCRLEPCRNGSDIIEGEFREGLIVTSNDNDWWYDEEKAWGKGIVTEVLASDIVKVESFEGDSNEYKDYLCGFAVCFEQDGTYAFKFSCD